MKSISVKDDTLRKTGRFLYLLAKVVSTEELKNECLFFSDLCFEALPREYRRTHAELERWIKNGLSTQR